ncbi:penicillin-binding protein 2 [Alkalitalea saponilacus]|uniref:Beta-lactamase n=1 Tax=Alkalitalea saponilacus TaxID=889453 RepID=A0A1T5A5G9_9BACT|nr:penicillin-binding protein 2 [Alkalitalea saponilacus]ASB48848.1 penicillin-binding protein 2 [Alkalitalea saponilacus]SKB29987.1 penicillin-binding protein 2 [Alkalitalea saponilacus]
MGNSNRAIIIGLFFGMIGLIFIIRLFVLQIVDPSYKFSAESNTQRKITEFPTRGLIYDRNGKLLVSNQPVYDLMIVPREVVPFDTVDFCNALNITRSELDRLFEEVRFNLQRRRISSFRPSVFYKQLPAEQYAILQEKLYKFKGFFVQRRTVRKYEYPNAAHVLGYVAEVGETLLQSDPYYSLGDYTGISGIERTYETFLRGQKGARYVMVDVHGREMGSLRGGRMDTSAVAGSDVALTLDIELQAYGEKIMQNKIGSIVAIEPSTGEILALVSSPSYDPSLLVGRQRSRNFPILSSDTLSPLLNRAIMSGYPPGSTFKVLMALVGLQENVLSPTTRYPCHQGYTARGIHVRCRPHASPISLVPSIAVSCNTFYCHVFRNVLDNPIHGSPQEGLEQFRNYLLNFGLGTRLGSDFFNENRGFVPTRGYYDRIYNGRWGSLTVLSLGIGQGEILTTPIQMANMTAAIANRGHYFTPHVIKEIENDTIPSRFKVPHHTGIDSVHFGPVIDGMEESVWSDVGATARIARIPGISISGKTGTAQNPHGENHSIFVAFAPKDDPKIAIAVYVENAGYGSTYAAPIASLMVEKYLNRAIHSSRGWIETRMMNANFINESTE